MVKDRWTMPSRGYLHVMEDVSASVSESSAFWDCQTPWQQPHEVCSLPGCWCHTSLHQPQVGQSWDYRTHQSVSGHGTGTLASSFPQEMTVRHLRETKWPRDRLWGQRHSEMVMIAVPAAVTTVILSTLSIQGFLVLPQCPYQDVTGCHHPHKAGSELRAYQSEIICSWNICKWGQPAVSLNIYPFQPYSSVPQATAWAVWAVYYMPDSAWSSLPTWLHGIFATTLLGSFYQYAHFQRRKPNQRGKSCLRSHDQQGESFWLILSSFPPTFYRAKLHFVFSFFVFKSLTLILDHVQSVN